MGWDGMLFPMRNANAAIVQCMSYSFLNERIWVKLSFSLAGICGEENAPSSSSHNHKIYFDNNIYNTTIFLLWIILKRNLILPFVLLFLSIPRLCPALVLCMLVEMLECGVCGVVERRQYDYMYNSNAFSNTRQCRQQQQQQPWRRRRRRQYVSTFFLILFPFILHTYIQMLLLILATFLST